MSGKKMIPVAVAGLWAWTWAWAVTYPVPHVTAGMGWQTQVVVDNAGFDAADVQVALYDQGTVAGTLTVSVPAGASQALDLGQGTCALVTGPGGNVTLKAAYTHLVENGIAEFRLAGETATALEFTLTPGAAGTFDWRGLAVMNPGDAPTDITLQALGADGQVLSQVVQNLGGRSRLAILVNEVFPAVDPSQVARVRAQSAAPLCGITISGKGCSRLLFTPAEAPPPVGGTLVIPHLADIYEDWDNLLLLDNAGTAAAAVTLNLVRQGTSVAQQALTVPAGATLEVNLNNWSALDPDSGTLTGCPTGLGARVCYVFRSTGATAEFALGKGGGADLAFNFPLYAGSRLGWHALCATNPSDHTASVVFKAYKGSAELDRVYVPIPARGRHAVMLDALFPGVYAQGIDRVVAASDTPLVGINLSGSAQDRYLFTPAAPWEETRTLAQRLAAAPGVTATPVSPIAPFTTCYRLQVTLPVDHQNAKGPTFTRTVYLSHTDLAAPMVLASTGYGMSRNYATELAYLLGANQVAMPHRYFWGAPMPGTPDWQYLTIAQAAADDHRVVTLLRDIYRGKWVNTGGSKGGMTAMFHRRFYPDDVHASVPYVAPLPLGLYDPRFENFVDNVAGTPECRDRLRALQRRMLSNHSAMVQRLQNAANLYGESYGRVGIDTAFEYMVMEYPVSWWQYGPNDCVSLPTETSSLDTLFNSLINTVGFLYSDSDLEYFEPFYYQALTEFGYYSFNTDAFDDLLQYAVNPSWATFAPQGVPMVYRPEVMPGIQSWVQTEGDRMLFIYGGNDPWTSYAVNLTGATDALKLTEPGLNHGTHIEDLTEKQLAYDALERWLGVTIDKSVPPKTLRAARREMMPRRGFMGPFGSSLFPAP
ncbi:MAG: hypothetical protein KA419_18070 [Acidobacteria bacterium]|nr:hypothetical protein [Acidobacteriota bacterium]